MNDKAGRVMRGIECFVGGVLVTSAFFKAVSPTEAAALLTVYGLPASLSLLFIQLEVVLGVILISGAASGLGRIAALVGFVGFACFSAYRALAGYESCGCFGAMKIHPWATFAFDLLVILLLVWSLHQSVAGMATEVRRRIALAVVSYLLLGGTVGGLSYVLQPQTLAGTDGIGASAGGLIILEPENWRGKKLPIAQYLSPPVDISRRHWTILLYHHDCPDCQAALPLYKHLAEQQTPSNDSHHVMLVEVPPYGVARQYGAAISARLSDDVEWFVQAPVEIQVIDGIVTKASRDLPSIAAFRKRVDSITTMQQPSVIAALE